MLKTLLGTRAIFEDETYTLRIDRIRTMTIAGPSKILVYPDEQNFFVAVCDVLHRNGFTTYDSEPFRLVARDFCAALCDQKGVRGDYFLTSPAGHAKAAMRATTSAVEHAGA
jgi:hypothetical protein